MYHLVIYMQSNKIHSVFFNESVYSSRMLAEHVSDLTRPSSGAFLEAVLADLVCGNMRTTQHVQPLRSCRKFFLQLCNSWTYRVVRVLPHTKSANTACKNAPDDGPVRSETCRANICDE